MLDSCLDDQLIMLPHVLGIAQIQTEAQLTCDFSFAPTIVKASWHPVELLYRLNFSLPEDNNTMTMGSISDMLARLDVKGTNGEPFPYSQHNQSGRLTIKSILGREDKGVGLHGQTITVAGWVKTGREQGKGAFAFLELNDGTCFSSLQVITTLF
jgi:hypothetical protein